MTPSPSGIGGQSNGGASVVPPPSADIPDGVSSAAKAAAQAWQAAMRQKKQPCVMAPWDENVYCLDPVVNSYVLPQNTDFVIAPSNPQRVALVFGTSFNNVAAFAISPLIPVDPTMGGGLLIGTSLPALVITQKDLLCLCTVEWHAYTGNVGMVAFVVEIVLRDWPKV